MVAALGCLLSFGILTLWVPYRWTVSTVQVGIFLLVAVWLLGVLLVRFPLGLHALMIPLGGAVIWGCLQIATGHTVYRWATEMAVLDWFARLAVFFLGLQIFTNAGARRLFLRVLLWFGFLLSVVAVLQRFTSPHKIFWLFPWEFEGAMGPFVYHNQFAAFVETILPLSLLYALTRKRESWLYLVMGGVLIASVVVANSRAGTALVIAETVAVAVLARSRGGYSRRTVLASIAGLGLFAVVFVAATGWEPLARKFERKDQYGVRRQLLYSSIEMTRARPLMGFGLGTWSTAYPAYARFDDGHFENQAHNDWAQWAAEGGLPFFALMVLMGALLVRPALRSIWGIGLLAVLAHCLVDYHFQQRPVFGYYYFALAAIVLVSAPAAQNDDDRARQNEEFEPE